jgi:transcriptional regulator with XRE-family HTH domain
MNSAKFKSIREKLGLTQEELSDMLGLSGRKPISHFETGFRKPSPLIQAIMSLLDSLSERKAAELVELFNDHMKKIKRHQKDVWHE